MPVTSAAGAFTNLPAPTDPPDVPYYLKALADRVEELIATTGWQDYPAEIRTHDGASAAAGTSIVFARWCRIGKTVHVIGEGSCASLVDDASVMLPAAAGTPLLRYKAAGILRAYPESVSDDQTGVAFMSVAKDRVILTAGTDGYRDAPAGSVLRWNLTYEVL